MADTEENLGKDGEMNFKAVQKEVNENGKKNVAPPLTIDVDGRSASDLCEFESMTSGRDRNFSIPHQPLGSKHDITPKQKSQYIKRTPSSTKDDATADTFLQATAEFKPDTMSQMQSEVDTEFLNSE